MVAHPWFNNEPTYGPDPSVEHLYPGVPQERRRAPQEFRDQPSIARRVTVIVRHLIVGVCIATEELVADELAAPADEDGRQIGQARPLLLVVLGRSVSESQALWNDVGPDLGVAGAGRVAPTTPTATGHGLRKVPRESCYPKALCGRWNGTIGQHSTAGAAARGVPNVAAMREPLHRRRDSAILSVPGRPKRKSWVNDYASV